MKKRTQFIRRFAAVILSVLFVSTALFAEGGASEVYLKGTSTAAAGDYVVSSTNDVYHFQGQEYAVYNVYYDNPSHNMKIAVLEEGDCKSYIAFTDDYWFMYNCTKEGFGVRKVMFSSVDARDTFDAGQFQDQTVLVKTRKIDKDVALGLIAAYMPKLQS
ncbi:MAG: hypothetical protein ACWGNV_08205 [Bacteroidales bacterium]